MAYKPKTFSYKSSIDTPKEILEYIEDEKASGMTFREIVENAIKCEMDSQGKKYTEKVTVSKTSSADGMSREPDVDAIRGVVKEELTLQTRSMNSTIMACFEELKQELLEANLIEGYARPAVGNGQMTIFDIGASENEESQYNPPAIEKAETTSVEYDNVPMEIEVSDAESTKIDARAAYPDAYDYAVDGNNDHIAYDDDYDDADDDYDSEETMGIGDDDENPIGDMDEEDNIVDVGVNVIHEETNVINEETNVIDEETNIIDEETNVIDEETNAINAEDNEVIYEETNVIVSETNVIYNETNVIDDETNVIDNEINVIEEELGAIVTGLSIGTDEHSDGKDVDDSESIADKDKQFVDNLISEITTDNTGNVNFGFHQEGNEDPYEIVTTSVSSEELHTADDFDEDAKDVFAGLRDIDLNSASYDADDFTFDTIPAYGERDTSPDDEPNKGFQGALEFTEDADVDDRSSEIIVEHRDDSTLNISSGKSRLRRHLRVASRNQG